MNKVPRIVNLWHQIFKVLQIADHIIFYVDILCFTRWQVKRLKQLVHNFNVSLNGHVHFFKYGFQFFVVPKFLFVFLSFDELLQFVLVRWVNCSCIGSLQRKILDLFSDITRWHLALLCGKLMFCLNFLVSDIKISIGWIFSKKPFFYIFFPPTLFCDSYLLLSLSWHETHNSF